MIFYEDEHITVCHGDVLDVLRQLPDDSLDSVVTDPPYGLEFMGKEWDGADGFRRSLNPADAGRDNVFGRTSQTSPEYRTTSSQEWKDTRTDKRGVINPAEWGGNQDSPSGGNAYSRSRVRTAAAHYRGDAAAVGATFQQWCQAWAEECLRVLKPGGHMLSFGGARTFHRMACAVEDAGFEIRDTISWLYGSGFPKSMDVSKAIDKAAGAEREVVGRRTDGRYAYEFNGTANRPTGAAAGTDDAERIGGFVSDKALVTAPATDDAKRWAGWGTALKPAWEPIVVARKPLSGTVAHNVTTYGTGALNIDGCRVPGVKGVPASPRRAPQGPAYSELGNDPGTGTGWDPTVGRWPTNVALDESQAAALDADTGTLTSGTGNKRKKPHQTDAMAGTLNTLDRQEVSYGDSGGASRYFPTFKYQAKAPKKERPVVEGTAHPTVKPLDLMRWLVRLVTPPDGWVLDPFAGSGTTGEAALAEGRRCVLIERQEEYLPLIKVRLDRAERVTVDQHADNENDTTVVA